jgi:hypothetical protein
MRTIRFYSILAIAVIVLHGCQPASLEPARYVKWVENEKNGLKSVKDFGDFKFSLQYKPLPYIVLKETHDPNTSAALVQKRSKELGSMQYYTLTISTRDKKELLKSHATSDQDYYDRLGYMVDEAQNDISLVEGNDTLPCRLYHFERDYGITPNAQILLGFDEPSKGNPDKERALIFDEKILGIGRIFLAVNSKAINNIPHLQLN